MRADVFSNWPRSQGRLSILGFVLACILFSLRVAFCDDATTKQPAQASSTKLPPIVCLHTEFLPYKDTETLRYRLMREMGRQALLIAARDELGLATRDETLGEIF